MHLHREPVCRSQGVTCHAVLCIWLRHHPCAGCCVAVSLCPVQLGSWDKALSLAPAVSHSYWLQLMQRKADALNKAGQSPNCELLTLLLASGQVGPAVELLMRQKQLDQAADVAAVVACG